MLLGISKNVKVVSRNLPFSRMVPRASSRLDIPRNRWVIAPTYRVTEPTPKAPAQAFRQT